MFTNLFDDQFQTTQLFNWVLLPLFIFLARTCDVSLGTLRNIFISKGLRKIVPVIGFFEVTIWLIAVSTSIRHLNNILCYVAFAGGFAMGTFVGMLIEKKLALGLQVMRIITHHETSVLLKEMYDANFGVTIMDAQGAKGPVKIIFTIVKRKDMPSLLNLVKKHNPLAFFTIEDIRVANQGVFREMERDTPTPLDYVKNLFPLSKGK